MKTTASSVWAFLQTRWPKHPLTLALSPPTDWSKVGSHNGPHASSAHLRHSARGKKRHCAASEGGCRNDESGCKSHLEPARDACRCPPMRNLVLSPARPR